MNQNLHLLYRSTLTKYRKFKVRFEKNIKSGQFYNFSDRKRNQIISRLERLKNRLQSLKFQIKMAIASGALVISLVTTEVNAQQLGPFVENKLGNPFRPSPSPAGNRHPAVVDIDNDGDLDVFVGTTYNSIFFLKNVGTASSPHFEKQTGLLNPVDGVYANNGTPVFADLDKDGDFDLILGQRYVYQFSPFANLIFLENTGSATNPIFTPPSGEHPVDNVFSDAYYAHPAFADMDDDGDLDAFVGSNRLDYAVYSENREAIKFWRNDGSLPIAQFASVNGAANPVSIVNPEFGGTLDRTAPALVDIDDDGDNDMFVGDINGTVHFFPNTGNASSPLFVSESVGTANPFDGVVFTNSASPEFADLDDDGDFDAIIGGEYDRLRFFENTGSVNAPIFTERIDQFNPFDGLHLIQEISPVSVDVDGDGFLDMIIGSNDDRDIHYYSNNQDGTFNKVTGTSNFFQGLLAASDYRPKPAVVDIDGDGDLDLFLALYSYSGPGYGHVRFFRNDGSNNLVEESTPITKNVNYSRYTLSMADFDKDGDFDAILGSNSVNYTNANFLFVENTGTALSPTFVEQPESGPPFNGAEIQVGVSTFPRPTMVDLDHDGDTDVVSGRFDYSLYGGEISFFENDGTDNLTQLTGTTNPFDGVSGGRNSHPAFLDVDNDGDLDLLIGNKYGEIVFIENQNIPPQVNNNTSSGTFTEGNVALVLDATLALSDDTDDNIISATIEIQNYVSGEDILSFTPQFGIIGNFDNTSGILTLTGTAKLAEYELVLQSITYENTSVAPNETIRNIQFSVTDFDNTDPFSDSFPEPVININVISVNSAPSMTTSGGTITYTENDLTANIDSGITLSDIDNTDLSSATIRITGNFNQSEDALVFTNQNGISGSYDAATGILSLSGTSSVANYQSALQSVQYINNSESPSELTRTIEFVVNDGVDDSNVGSKQINVVSVNDIPVLSTSSTDAIYTEGDGQLIIDAGLTISDLDNIDLTGATISITSNFDQDEDALVFTNQNGISGSYDAVTGILSLSGTSSVANYQSALQSVQYINNSESPSELTRTIEFVVNDGADDSNVESKQINVVSVNDIPVLSGTVTSAISYTQNATPVILDAGLAVTDIDNVQITSVIVSISSFQSGDVLNATTFGSVTPGFNSTTGVLTLSGSPTATLADFNGAVATITFSSSNGAGSRQIDFIANDGTDNSVIHTIDVTISNMVTQPPVVDPTPATTQVGSTVTIDLCNIVTDPDNTFEELTIEVVSILSGAVTEIIDCDLNIDYFGTNFSGEDIIVIRATDPDGNVDENSLTITVEEVIEPGGELIVYNAVSPNNDGLNDWWEIVNLTTPNQIKLFNRWGDLVKTITDYQNTPDNSELNDIPAGTYFYQINSPQGSYEGYIVIKK